MLSTTMATTYRYEARYHGSSDWMPIPEWMLRKRLGANIINLDVVIQDMHAGDEADDETMIYRAVKIIDEANYRVVFTSAPVDFDGFGTQTLAANAGTDHRGIVLRKVAIRPEHYEWQTVRYGSGSHTWGTPEEVKRFPQLFSVT